jgi:hypothetical protein
MGWMTGCKYTAQGVRGYAVPPSEAADVLGYRGEQMRPPQGYMPHRVIGSAMRGGCV